MSEIRKAVEGALGGDDRAFASFGVERRLSTGIMAQPSGVFQWEQRLMLSGIGMSRLVLYRPVGDQCGIASGVYQSTFGRERVRELAEMALSTGILEYDPGHIEPGDLMIRLRFAAMGIAEEVLISADSPPREKPVRDFLSKLSSLYTNLLSYPLRTVAMSAQLQDSLPKAGSGRKRVPMLLTLRNDGSQGHWMRHPEAMLPDGSMERRYVTWMPAPKVGELPPPASLGALEPVNKIPPGPPDEEEKPLWLPAGSSVEIPCSAIVNFAEPGKYYMHAGYITMAGEQTYQGQPRWIGGLFSEVMEVNVTR
jgi:hypothetical protein